MNTKLVLLKLSLLLKKMFFPALTNLVILTEKSLKNYYTLFRTTKVCQEVTDPTSKELQFP